MNKKSQLKNLKISLFVLILIILSIFMINAEVTDVSSVSMAVTPNFVNVSDTVTFGVTWGGSDYGIFVCKNSDCSGCNSAGQSDCFCYNLTAQSSPFSCDYTTQDSDASTNNYYYVMFHNDSDNSYSAVYYSSDAFDVNHKPSATSVSLKPDYANETSTLNCTYTYYDPENDDEYFAGTTFIWYRDQGAGYAVIGGETSQTLDNSGPIYFVKGDKMICSVSVQDENGLNGDYFNSSEITILGESAPNVTGVSSNSEPNERINEGNYVTFIVNWTDSDIDTHPGGEGAKVIICNDTFFDTTLLTCNSTVFCETSFSSSTSVSCQYQTTGDETNDSDGSVEYYAYVIDDGDMYNVSGQNIFYINHAPDIDRIRLMPYGSDYYQNIKPFNCTDVSFMTTTASFGGNSANLHSYYGVNDTLTGTSMGYLDNLYLYHDGATSPSTSVLTLGMDVGFAAEQIVSIVTDQGTVFAQIPKISGTQGNYDWRLYVASDGSTYFRTDESGNNRTYSQAFTPGGFAKGIFLDNDNILCNITGVEDLDSPGDSSNITYTIRWYLNRSGVTYIYDAPDWPVITHGNTKPGDVWYCKVTLSDGMVSSSPHYSDNVTIRNNDGSGGLAPYITNYYTNSNMSDPLSVGDQVSFTVSWGDDGDPNEEVKIYICNSSFIDKTGCFDKEFVQSSWTTERTVSLSYTVNESDPKTMPYWILICDDTGADENNTGGNWLCSNYPTFSEMGNITINHQPVLNRSVSMNWSSYPNDPAENDNLICDYFDVTDNGDVYDVDADNITLTYRWYLNRTGSWTLYSVPPSTRILTHGNIQNSDTWRCEITPNDYYSAGISKNSSPVRIWQSNWSIPSIDLMTDNSDYLNPILVGSPVNFHVEWSDLDGDSVKLYICNSTDINETGCVDGIFYESTNFQSTDFDVSYTVKEIDLGLMNYYARVCDNSGAAWVCSDLSSGSFVVNHKPNVTAISLVWNVVNPFLADNVTNVTTTVQVSGIPINNEIYFYYNVSSSIAPENFSIYGILDSDTHSFTHISDSQTDFPLVIGGNGSVIEQTLTLSIVNSQEPSLEIYLPQINVTAGTMWYLYISADGSLYFANDSNSFENTTVYPGVSLDYDLALDPDYLFSPSNKVYETSNLLCNVDYYDKDGQYVTGQYEWYLNRGSGFEKYLAPNTKIMTHGNILIGDLWYCSVKLSDGFVTGEEFISQVVNVSLIGNSGRPTIISVLDDVNPQKRIHVGGQVNFSINWSDLDSTQVNLYICNSTNIGKLGCLDGLGNPDNSSALFEIHDFTTANPITGSYVVKSEDMGTVNYYAIVCDNTGGIGGNWLCSDIYMINENVSTSSSGNFTVNHYPTILSDAEIAVFGSSQFFNENTSMICNVTPMDVNGTGVLNETDLDNDLVYVYYNWYRNRTGEWQKLSFSGSRYLSHTQVEMGDSWMCEAVAYDDYSIGNSINSSIVSITSSIPGNSSPTLKSLVDSSNRTTPVVDGDDLEFDLMFFDNDSLEFTFYICNESYGVDISKAKGGCNNFGAYEFVQTNITRPDYTTYLYSPATFEWDVDDTLHENSTNITYFAWLCDHTPGVGSSNWKCTSPVNETIIINHKPTIENGTVFPSIANVTTNLECRYNYSTQDTTADIFDDDENTNLTLYKWYKIVNKTGSLSIINLNSKNINNSQATFFEKNDKIWCVVRSADKFSLYDDEYENSTLVIIGDAYPEPNVTITPEYPDYDEHLYCNVNVNDPDDDEYNITYRWFYNGNINNQPLPGYDNSMLLRGYNIVGRDNWTCLVNLTRGNLNYTLNTTILINQTPPVIPNASQNISVLNITALYTINESYQIGWNVTFNLNWTGWDENTTVIWFICNSSNITKYGCYDAFICPPPTQYTNDTSVNCTINTSSYEERYLTYYGRICDQDGNCSDIVNDEIFLSLKKVVPKPIIENVTIIPSDPNITSLLNCTYDYSGLGYSENSSLAEFKWYKYNNITSEYELIPNQTLKTLSNSIDLIIFDKNDTLMCSANATNINFTSSDYVNSSNVTINSDGMYYNLSNSIYTDNTLTFTFTDSMSNSLTYDNDNVTKYLFMHEIFNLSVTNYNSSFIALIYNVNVSANPTMTVFAEFNDVSVDIKDAPAVDVSINNSKRYLYLFGYAFELSGLPLENVTIGINYSALSGVVQLSRLRILKLEYNFSSHNFGNISNLVYNTIDNNTSDWAYLDIGSFSYFMAVYDQAQSEICDNDFDDDYDGTIDENCNTGGSGSSGGSSSRSGPIIFLPPTGNCSDGIKNQNEILVDCGGICDACVVQPIAPNITESCYDNIRNQDEVGVDCGGKCKTCPSCYDGIRNQGEGGVDCGGPCSNKCISCSDGVKNQGETGVDCGGPCSKSCVTCSDGNQNQGEEGVDCGGPCSACIIIEEPKPLISGIVFLIVVIILLSIAMGTYMLRHTISDFLHKHSEPVTKEQALFEKTTQVTSEKSVADSKKIPPLKTELTQFKDEYTVDDLGLKPDERLNLEKYIYHELSRGFSEVEIKDALFTHGWPTLPVENLFRRIRTIEEGLFKHDLHTPHENFEALLQSLQGLFNTLWSEGYREEEIKGVLVNKGWPKEQIDKAVEYLMKTYNRQFTGS